MKGVCFSRFLLPVAMLSIFTTLAMPAHAQSPTAIQKNAMKVRYQECGTIAGPSSDDAARLAAKLGMLSLADSQLNHMVGSILGASQCAKKVSQQFCNAQNAQATISGLNAVGSPLSNAILTAAQLLNQPVTGQSAQPAIPGSNQNVVNGWTAGGALVGATGGALVGGMLTNDSTLGKVLGGAGGAVIGGTVGRSYGTVKQVSDVCSQNATRFRQIGANMQASGLTMQMSREADFDRLLSVLVQFGLATNSETQALAVMGGSMADAIEAMRN